MLRLASQQRVETPFRGAANAPHRRLPSRPAAIPKVMNRSPRPHGRQQMNVLLFEVSRAVETSRITEVARPAQAAQKLDSLPVLERQRRIPLPPAYRHPHAAPRNGVLEDRLDFKDEPVGQIERLGWDSDVPPESNRVVKVGLLVLLLAPVRLILRLILRLINDGGDQQRVRPIRKRCQLRAGKGEPRQTGCRPHAQRSRAPREYGQASQQCNGNQRFPKTKGCVLRDRNARHQNR